MKRHIVSAVLLLAAMAVQAQTGTFRVTNQSTLKSTAIEDRLRSSDFEITSEDGTRPTESDNSEIFSVMAQWLMQEQPDEAEMLAGDVPAQVTIDKQRVGIMTNKGDTIRAYNIKEVIVGNAKWTIICTNDAKLKLSHLGGDRYALSAPGMERLELRKTE